MGPSHERSSRAKCTTKVSNDVLLFVWDVFCLMSMHTILLSLSTITDGKPTNKSRVHGAPNHYSLKEHGLTLNSPPVDFINVFLPKMNRKKNFCEKNAVQFVCRDYVPMVKWEGRVNGYGRMKLLPELSKHLRRQFWKASLPVLLLWFKSLAKSTNEVQISRPRPSPR